MNLCLILESRESFRFFRTASIRWFVTLSTFILYLLAVRGICAFFPRYFWASSVGLKALSVWDCAVKLYILHLKTFLGDKIDSDVGKCGFKGPAAFKPRSFLLPYSLPDWFIVNLYVGKKKTYRLTLNFSSLASDLLWLVWCALVEF